MNGEKMIDGLIDLGGWLDRWMDGRTDRSLDC